MNNAKYSAVLIEHNDSGSDEKLDYIKKNLIKSVVNGIFFPFLMILFIAIQDILSLIHAKPFFDQEVQAGLTITSTVRLLIYGISSIHSTGSGTLLASLILDKEIERCSRLLVDIIRVNILQGLLVSFGFGPCIKLIINSTTDASVTEKSKKIAINYCYLLLTQSLFISLFQTLSGLFIAVGKPAVTGLLYLSCILISLLITDSIVIHVIKVPELLGASFYAPVCFFAVVLVILLFLGKLPIKVNLRMFINGVSPDFALFMKLNIPLIIKLLLSFTAVFTASFIAKTAKDEYVTVYTSGGDKVYTLLMMIMYGVFAGCVPDLTAIIKHREKKLLFRYCYIALIFPIFASFILTVIMIVKPKIIVSAFLDIKNEDVLNRYVPPEFYVCILIAPTSLMDSLILISKRPLLSCLSSAFGAIIQFISSFILYKTAAQKKPEAIMYCAPISCASTFLFVAFLAYTALRKTIFESQNHYSEF